MFSRSTKSRRKVAVVENATVRVVKPEQSEPAIDLKNVKMTVLKPKKKVKIIKKGED